MAEYQHIRKRFFQYSNRFADFKDVTEEKLIEIKKDVEAFDKRINAYLKFCKKTPLNYLMTVLEHVYSLRGSDSYSYDERVLFIILACDPELKTYKTYLSYPDFPVKSKKLIENNIFIKKKFEEYKSFRQQLIRDAVGYYEPYLLIYEQVYFDKFVKNKEFITNVQKNYVDKIFEMSKEISSFDSVAIGRFDELSLQIQDFISFNGDFDYNTVAFNLVKQNGLLCLKSVEEILVYFILLIDPELKALTIYNEECKIDKISERIVMELGFYSNEIVRIEKLIAARFFVGKDFDDWTLAFKD